MDRAWAQYLHKIDPVNVLEVIVAPARVMRRIPNIAKEESIQIITDILFMHTRAQGKEAIWLDNLLLRLPKCYGWHLGRRKQTKKENSLRQWTKPENLGSSKTASTFFLQWAMGRSDP